MQRLNRVIGNWIVLPVMPVLPLWYCSVAMPVRHIVRHSACCDLHTSSHRSNIGPIATVDAAALLCSGDINNTAPMMLMMMKMLLLMVMISIDEIDLPRHSTDVSSCEQTRIMLPMRPWLVLNVADLFCLIKLYIQHCFDARPFNLVWLLSVFAVHFCAQVSKCSVHRILVPNLVDVALKMYPYTPNRLKPSKQTRTWRRIWTINSISSFPALCSTKMQIGEKIAAEFCLKNICCSQAYKRTW